MLFIPDLKENYNYAQKQAVKTQVKSLLSQTACFRHTAFVIDNIHEKIYLANYNQQLFSIFPEQNTVGEYDEKQLLKMICEADIGLFQEILQIMSGNNCCRGLKWYSFSFIIKFADNLSFQGVKVSICPLMDIHSTIHKRGVIIYCHMDISQNTKSGQLTIYDMNEQNKFYCLLTDTTAKKQIIIFNEVELSIFRLASQGYSETEITQLLNLSMGNFRYIKAKIMSNTNVRSTAQVISLMTKQGFI
jgi:hypothetical protein